MNRRSRPVTLLIGSLLLSGCTMTTGEQDSAPGVSSDGARSSASPTIGNPAASGGASRNDAGAGSFPRSFLIPGTDTSIRIGG